MSCSTQNANKTGVVDGFPVGVILDLQTMVGKIARTSILMALDDFYAAHTNYSTKIVLHIRDSGSNNVQAASAALDLLENHNVQIIIGPQTSSQASFVSDLGNRSQVPVISFTATSPSLYSASLPYFVRATLNDSAQVQSIACLIKTYGWREVVPIYEDTDYGRGIIPYLVDALQDIDARVPYRSVIPLSVTSEEISQELYKLMTMQTRVFIVHMSSTLAASLFTKAKEVGMMSKGFVWIMTDGITNIVDSMSTSVVEAMNGALGIQFYVNNSELDNFTIGWNRRFQIDNPNDPPLKLSIFGLWGYDTIWAVAQAVENVGVNNRTSIQKPSVARNSTSLENMETSVYGPELLKVILRNKFRGKSGYFDLSNRQLQVSTFRIINVFGKGWKDIGFWNEGNGISRQLNLGKSTTKYASSVSGLNLVTWPGNSTETPKGWEIPASGKKLQVGVHKSAYKEYMTNQRDPITGATKASGFSIDIFEEAVKRLPFALPYEYVAFDTSRDTSTGSYDDFVHQVYLKKYDVAIGDITIRHSRMAYVDFTVPYTESGVAMIVPSKGTVDKTWIFLQPLSCDLWVATISMIELNVVKLTGWKGKMNYMPVGVRLETSFANQLKESYTANLATMLTVQQLKPTINSIDELRKSGENIGYHDGSFVKNLLEDLNFNTSKIKAYDTPDDFYNALSKGSNNGGIAAFVHEVPYIKLFLAKHCKEYTMAFPKGSPLLGDISKAILSITEGDIIMQLENKWIGYQNDCKSVDSAVGTVSDPDKLNVDSFKGLFILTGVASTSSLLIAVMIYYYEKKKSMTSMQPDQNGEGLEENHKPQEVNEGDREEENNQPGASTGQTGQQQQQTGAREMSNINLQTSSVRRNSSIFIWHERNLGARVAPISSSTGRAAIFFLFLSLTVAQNITGSGEDTLNVGVILHLKSLVGKMARTSILMAVEDFYKAHRNFKTKLVLHIRDSNGDDIQAASEAIDLLENYNVRAIVGPQKSSEATFVSDLGNKSQVPVISFTATNPTLSSINVPYFLRGTLSDVAQVNTLAALVKAYGWREVVPIYEDTDYGRGIIPYLADALQEFGASMPYRSAISESANTDQIERELYKLMTMQTRVYVVHMSTNIGSILFKKAKDLGMMSEDYAWILTDGISNIANSLSPSILEEMSGAIGVRFYVPASKELDDFTTRWNKRFKEDNPNDPPSQLSIFGLWGYDTIWALAQAAEKVRMADAIFQKQKGTKNTTCLGTLRISAIGPKLLDSILHSKFRGLSGEFDLRNRQLEFSTFQIINVVGSQLKEIGFWTAKHGIFRQLNKNKSKTTNMNSVPDLNPVVWPGEVHTVPKGWQIPTNGKKLRIGVRTNAYPEFMKVESNPVTNEITASGYAIDVFEEVLKRLPYAIPYEYVSFDNGQGINSGSYNDFVYQVYLGVYDAAIGDITIRYNRTSYVDFTLPYTESGVAMIVPVKDDRNKNTWVFLKPLTTDLWFGSIAFFIYTAIVIWLLERRSNNAELTGSFLRQLGIAIYFSFFADRERVDSILSRLVVIVWVFVLLVITSSYTANLSSMLTVQQLQPTVTDVHELLKNGEYVGYPNGSYVADLLRGLGFDRTKLRAYNDLDGFADALAKGSQNGGISAVIDEVPYIKIFLAKHCKGYTMIGPIYKSEGFGFAFPKRSPLVYDFSRAILSITEGDSIINIEKKWIGDQHACQNDGTIISSSSLNFNSFSGLFLVTGVASTSALLIALVMFLYKNKHRIRNSIRRDQTQKGYEAERINEQNQEMTIHSNQVHNLQLTVPDDSDEYRCQQDGEISIEQSPASEVQTSPIQTTAAAVMEKAPHSILFLLLVVNFCAADQDTTRGRAEEFHVGVILDLGSLVGKVARTSISLAVEDFYMVHRNYSTRLVLHFRDSMASDVRAASAEDKLERFLSRLVLLVWMFVLLVLTSSYTASFASMLTVQQLSPAVNDVHELQKQGEYVGFHRGSYIEGLLEDIGFDRSKIRPLDTPDDFHSALSNGSKDGGVAALVLEVPYIKLFLAKYCQGYTMVGPIYKTAGFAFALPKRSPLLTDISRAILNITEGDAIIQIEKKWIGQNSCQNDDKVDGSGSITLGSFGGLFLLTGVVTTCSLIIALLTNWHNTNQKSGTEGDDQNQHRHGEKRENGHAQGDQKNEDNRDYNDTENQTKLSVPQSLNTNDDEMRDDRPKNSNLTF
uniref:Ionotropic glutamate receptor C-terminal domain-containing protein n=1 Tax=Oryza glumipatula TaxID=40148 RepID=A0A0E0B397_9ORYZ